MTSTLPWHFDSTQMAIMGRLSAYTGKALTREEINNSTLDLSPEKLDWTEIAVRPIARPAKHNSSRSRAQVPVGYHRPGPQWSGAFLKRTCVQTYCSGCHGQGAVALARERASV